MFRFCPECGTEPVAGGPTREQRKTVTVLFCDLTGSTALGETLDPERLRTVLARYFEEMKTIVERHGGYPYRGAATPHPGGFRAGCRAQRGCDEAVGAQTRVKSFSYKACLHRSPERDSCNSVTLWPSIAQSDPAETHIRGWRV